MVVGGRTAIAAAPMSCARAASCASPCRCCPDLVWSPTPLSSGGMWSAQLRSPPPPHAAASQPATGHGCAALPDKQALFLVAFPICASSNGNSQASQLHPAATATSSTCCCRCCCKCSWSAKPPSTTTSTPCWTAQQDASSPAGRNTFLLSPKEEEGKPSSGLPEDRLMEVPPPSPPSPTNAQQRYGNQPHLSPSPGAPPPGGAASDVDVDLSRVRDALRTLRTSGYYYEGLSWEEAGRLLRGRSVGTFLVRDSSDNRFLFALSVQTERGPTSVRIHYWRGQFRLDCEDALAGSMPWFSCVVSLVEHYVQLSRSAKGQMCVWLDGHGRRDLPIMLTRPLYREPASLQHLCRIALNRSAGAAVAAASRTVEPLPAALKDYLRDYPHLH
ncbi:cytokine-inducible SH2-containing protein isoform X2 [Dermacentor silvarum]|nr:cytokine-inducible SH2-containing protein isoform X2 [Dermacentor silvarum]